MVRIVWTEPALLDLNEIAGYIALENAAAARRLVKRVFDRVDHLRDYPRSGRRPPELRKSRYREVIVGPCRIFYRQTDEDILILYIMRGERQLRNYIVNDRDESGS